MKSSTLNDIYCQESKKQNKECSEDFKLQRVLILAMGIRKVLARTIINV